MCQDQPRNITLPAELTPFFEYAVYRERIPVGRTLNGDGTTTYGWDGRNHPPEQIIAVIEEAVAATRKHFNF